MIPPDPIWEDPPLLDKDTLPGHSFSEILDKIAVNPGQWGIISMVSAADAGHSYALLGAFQSGALPSAVAFEFRAGPYGDGWAVWARAPVA